MEGSPLAEDEDDPFKRHFESQVHFDDLDPDVPYYHLAFVEWAHRDTVVLSKIAADPFTKESIQVLIDTVEIIQPIMNAVAVSRDPECKRSQPFELRTPITG